VNLRSNYVTRWTVTLGTGTYIAVSRRLPSGTARVQFQWNLW
jgi:hypothetical protein